MISVTIQSPNAELDVDWDDLVSRAHPNVFMTPAALRAADATMFANVRVLAAWDDSVQPRRLVGLWALQQRRPMLLRPVIFEALPFEYAFLSSPVIDKDVVASVMPAFIEAIAHAPDMPRVILMKSLDADAASFQPMIDAIAARGGRALTIKTESRPAVWRSQQGKVAATGERRKKLRQGWKRMSALGVTAMVAATEPGDVAAAVEAFLQIEFSSWKGAAGTALLCRDEDATFVRRLIVDLAAKAQAMVHSLQIDGKTIATQIVLFSGTMAYTWKTAFDPAYARYSPGVIVIDRVTEDLFKTTEIAGIDSCSAENSFVAQLWTGRQAMADVLVDLKPGLSVGFWLEAAWQRGREELKRLRDRVLAFRASRRAKPPIAATGPAAPAMSPKTPRSGTSLSLAVLPEHPSPPLASMTHSVHAANTSH